MVDRVVLGRADGAGGSRPTVFMSSWRRHASLLPDDLSDVARELR